MSKMQRADDVGAVLRLLPHFLRLEMHQLWRDHRSHDFQQSKKESGSSGDSTGISTLTIKHLRAFSSDQTQAIKSPQSDSSRICSGVDAA